MDALLGIDLGTSGVKAMLIDSQGNILGEATVSYPLRTPHPGWSEQLPEDWWQGAAEAIHQVRAQHGAQVLAVALSGQMHGATLLDAAGTVLRPAILWNDQRTGAQCDWITGRVGMANLVHWVANPALAGFTAPKLLWVREHEPEIFRRIDCVLLPKDYVNFRLTGARVTEVSDASGTLLFDVTQRRWSQPMLDALQLPASILPPVHDSSDVIGTIQPEAASVTGLPAGTPVVAGGADNACAAIGLGVVAPGQVLCSIGTSGTILAPSREPRLDPQGRLHTFCHAIPDTWYQMGVVLSAGGSLRWYRDTMAPGESYDALLAEAETAPPGSEGLLFLPYLTGERTPHADPEARGVFCGLTVRHGRPHLTRSVVEGVTFALADAADIMRQTGLEITTVRAAGGGARSNLWRQIQADVLRAGVETAHSEGGPAFGAALLAGVGVGMFPSVPAATQRLITMRSHTTPGPAAEAYRQWHAIYRELYPALASSMHQIAELVHRSAS